VERANGMVLEALRKKVFEKMKSLQEVDQRVAVCGLELENST
jgi:hypothetical protein